jgi:hypothetical protein
MLDLPRAILSLTDGRLFWRAVLTWVVFKGVEGDDMGPYS